MIQNRPNSNSRIVIACILLAIVTMLSSCVTPMGYKDNEPIPVTMKFRTTSDHFYFKIEGMSVEDASLEPSTFTQPQWANVGGDPLIVQGAQGVDMASRGGVQEFVFAASLFRRDGFDVLKIPYGKGHMGSQSLEVTYPDDLGKLATKRFTAVQGPAEAEGVWTLPLKAIKAVEQPAPPPELAKGADLRLLGTWGIPQDTKKTTLTFRADATATVANFPDRDGKSLISGEFKYETYPGEPGKNVLGTLFRWDAQKRLYEYSFNFKILDDGQTLMIGINEGPGWSMLPKVKG